MAPDLQGAAQLASWSRNQLSDASTVAGMPVVTFAALKGGVSKTTSSVCTATAAASTGRRVVIADTDPQQTVTRWTEGLDAPFTVVPIIGPAIADHIRRLDTDDTVVIVDTPPGEKDQSIVAGAVNASHLVISPCSPNGTDVDRLSVTLALTEAMGVPTAILIVRTDPRWRDHKDLVAILDEDEDLIRLPTCIPERRALGGAFRTIPGPDLFGYAEVWADINETLQKLT